MLHTIKRIVYYLFHKPSVILFMGWEKFAPYFTTDKFFLKVKGRFLLGYWIDFDSPKTFSEKIQWLKLNDIHPEYTQMVDKVAAKDYVGGIIGEKYIIPTYGVWDSVSSIDWDSLPNQFVIKSTSDSGGVVICRNKNQFEKQKAIEKLSRLGNRDYTRTSKEYPYKNVPHRFIAEALLSNGLDKDLPDYKFFCFNGEPKYCQVIRSRSEEEKVDFFDMEWNHQDFVGLLVHQQSKNSEDLPQKPAVLDEIICICRKLARNIPFIRIDLYIIQDKIYFGELTFFPAGGFGSFTPDKWNVIIGDLLKLPV